MIDFKYKPDGDTLKEFMKDDTFFRGIRGPVGSGKEGLALMFAQLLNCNSSKTEICFQCDSYNSCSFFNI